MENLEPVMEIESLLSFLNSSVTAYQATACLKRELLEAGFVELQESEPWSLEARQRYFVTRNETSLIAFIMPEVHDVEVEFRLVGAHTDSPAFKVKSQGSVVANGCMKSTIEVYGGPIVSSWMDRPLALAGRVILRSDEGVISRLIHIDEPVAIIPNLAIHLNREINSGFSYNNQTQLPIIMGQARHEEDDLRHFLAENYLACAVEDILDYDLYTVPYSRATRVGLHQEFISCGRLDNLLACHSMLQALIRSSSFSNTVLVGMFFDHEEIGSQSLSGASSSFASTILERIMLSYGGSREDYLCALARSFMISNDAAHGIHPNYPEKHDPAYSPTLNNGPVIKCSASQRYMTGTLEASVIRELCRKFQIPCQTIINRSDIPSGSTIGPVSSATLGVPGIDIGIAMWAMHSSCETAGIDDYGYMIQLLQAFYQADILV